MNLLKHELRTYRKSLIYWSVGILFMILSGMGKYTTISSGQINMDELFNSLPKIIRAIFGIGDFELATPIGFYGVLYMYLLIMGAVHASMLGANILSKEQSEKTSEFLFTKPITRRTIITSKLVAATFNVVVFNIITYLISLVMLSFYSKEQSYHKEIFLFTLGLFFVQLIFLSIGTLIASINKRPKTSASLATGVLLSSFMLSVFISVSEKLEFLTFLSPFKYFDVATIINDLTISLPWSIFSIVLVIVFTYFTYYFYERKDLN